MNGLREELLNDLYWEETYNKMILKPGLKKQEENILYECFYVYKDRIIDSLFDGTYEWSVPEKVGIAKEGTKKKRIVYIYSIKDRYILGVLYRAVSAYYADLISPFCFSYKKTISTNDAIKYIRDIKVSDRYYGVKIDIHSYFNSVSRERVIGMIDTLFSGGLKSSIEKLMLDDKVLYKGREIQEWKSLIPGCAFGSFFANYCLRDCDSYFEKNNKIYARYSDDIIILEESREELSKSLAFVKQEIQKYDLVINPKKYTWFEPDDEVEYLGLKLKGDNNIDISDHAKKKIKRQIHRWCRKGRMEIERDGKSFNKVAKQVIRKFNNKNMFCIIENETTFGWCHYAFRYITTVESLREIDYYMRDTLRAMKTGRHNSANVNAIDDDEFKELGWVSLVDMYYLYKKDFDYYMEIVELMKNT